MVPYGALLRGSMLLLSSISVHGWARAADKAALWELYEATDGPNWAISALAPDDPTLRPGGPYKWDNNTDPCPTNPENGWHGVSCNDPCYYPIDGDDCKFGRITGLQLGFNGLVGTIPNSVFDKLINLTIVDFSHNSLSGTLPTQVGKLRNAMVMHLQMNSLSGTIPTEIRTIGSHVAPDEMALALEDLPASALTDPLGDMTNSSIVYPETPQTMGLSQLDLAHNLFNGTIPTTIGELVNLQALDISNNPELGADGCCDDADSFYQAFYGYNWSIPTEIGELKKLQVLKMDNSRFMRHLPTEIGKMRSLVFWRLKADLLTNEVSGTIPTEIGQLSKLQQFVAGNNSISGTIPNEIVDMSSLRVFTFENNRVSGSIPDVFGGTPELYHWDSFNNKMEGDLPDSVNDLTNLDYLYIQNEHTGSMRNHHCKQRFDMAANGKKFNFQVLGNEHFAYKTISACANPFDLHATFDALDGDA